MEPPAPNSAPYMTLGRLNLAEPVLARGLVCDVSTTRVSLLQIGLGPVPVVGIVSGHEAFYLLCCKIDVILSCRIFCVDSYQFRGAITLQKIEISTCLWGRRARFHQHLFLHHIVHEASGIRISPR